MKLARVITTGGQTVSVAEKDGKLYRVEGNILDAPHITDEVVDAKEWLSPIDSEAIICIGANYKAHAEESGKDVPEYPIVFMKNLSAAIGHEQPIKIPKVCEDEVDYEAELVVVIGKTCLNATKANALDYVLGYTCANDVSARIWQAVKGGSQWVRGKAFDTFAPMGPFIITSDEIPDPNTLRIQGRYNGETVQDSNTDDMIFDVPTLIEFLSQDTTLLPGTVILTGTPEGVGWARSPKLLLKSGVVYEVEIEKVGTLKNQVA
ncbi:MAG: fumarylacetoacetate hydrolase family protein [Candidatus Omnitrophica bacterium]|nr:fumarylacetoacetate hydrolase family protein [Candidatus Omnitrophota bacterium]